MVGAEGGSSAIFGAFINRPGGGPAPIRSHPRPVCGEVRPGSSYGTVHRVLTLMTSVS
jgi:hypothetical protein